MPQILRYNQPFIPPAAFSLLPALVNPLVPLILKANNLEIRPTKNCIDLLTKATTAHTVLIPNHSDQCDPIVMFALSTMCRQEFYYIAARELFDQNFGLRGLFLQHSGAYSVIRGGSDLNYIKATQELLVRGKRKLVMFAEGDVTGAERNTVPLKRDGIDLLLEAQARLSVHPTPEQLQIVPISVYFHAHDDVPEALANSLTRLESAVGIPGNAKLDLESRTRRVVSVVVEHLERFYGTTTPEDLSESERIRQLCRHAIDGLRHFVSAENGKTKDEFEALHSVRFAFRTAPNRKMGCACLYCRRLHKLFVINDQELIEEFESLQQLLLLAQTLEQSFSPLIAWRVVDRLETQVHGRTFSKGHRTAFVEAGAPLAGENYLAEYKTHKDAAIANLSADIRSAIDSLLLNQWRQFQDTPRVLSR